MSGGYELKRYWEMLNEMDPNGVTYSIAAISSIVVGRYKRTRPQGDYTPPLSGISYVCRSTHALWTINSVLLQSGIAVVSYIHRRDGGNMLSDTELLSTVCRKHQRHIMTSWVETKNELTRSLAISVLYGVFLVDGPMPMLIEPHNHW